MPFLKLSNADMAFNKKTLTWKSYTTKKALLTTKQVQLVNSKKFVIAPLNTDSETFVVHVAIRKQEEMAINPNKKTQIKVQSKAQSKTKSGTKSGAKVRALIFDKALTEVLVEYSDYSNAFSVKNATELLENTGMNKHAIKLEKGKQPLFGPIYSLGPVELETLKTYIKINLANDFIRHFKSSAGASILFDRKPHGSLHLCIDYWDLNNIIIKNQYLLLLIGESLDWLG